VTTGGRAIPGATTYELLVDGSVGPVLQAALAGETFVSLELSTVIRVRESPCCGLVEILQTCESAGLSVQEIHARTDSSPA
jgi:hypothetical protein